MAEWWKFWRRDDRGRAELAAPLNGTLGVPSGGPQQPAPQNGQSWKSTTSGPQSPAVFSPSGQSMQTINKSSIPDLPPPASPAQVAEMLMGEEGISGIANYYGRIWDEETPELQWLLAFQFPGAGVFGQWEALHRRNPYVAAGLESVKAQVRDCRVDVEAAEGVENADLHAKIVEWNIKEYLEPGFARVLEQMVESILYGFNLHEIVMEPVQHQLFGGWGMAVSKLQHLMAKSVYENGWVTQDRELKYIKQRGPVDGQFMTVDLPAEKVLLTTWNRNGDNYAGYSAYRPVWYPCRVMEHCMRLAGVSMVREAAGVPIATIDPAAPTMTAGARKKLQRFLMNLVYHEQAAVVLPPGVKLDWWVSPGRDKTGLMKQYQDLGKLVLFQTQSQQMALGLSETGSRSVGEVHASTNQQFAQGVLSLLEEVLNGSGRRPYTGLPRKILQANFPGIIDAYPKIRLSLKRGSLEPNVFAPAIQQLLQVNALTWRAEDENGAREIMGLPPIDEDERSLARAQLALPAPGTTGQSPAGANPPGQQTPGSPGAGGPPSPAGGSSPKRVDVVRPPGSKPISKVDVVRPPGSPPVSDVHIHPKPDAAPKAAWDKASDKRRKLGAFETWRDLRPSEQKLDLHAIDNFLNRARDNFDTEARAQAAAMLARAKPQIRDAMKSGDFGAVRLDPVELTRFVRSYIDKCAAFGAEQVAKEREQGSAAVKKERADGSQRLAPVIHFAVGDDEEAEKQKAAMAAQVSRRIVNRLSSNLENDMINADRTGEDEDEAISETMGDILDSGAFRQDAGLLTTKAFNVGREEFAAAHGDEVESVELSAILDKAVCSECEDLDGSTFDFGSAEHDAYTPPLKQCEGGDQCRCVLLYNFKSEGDSPDEGDDE